MSLRIQISDLLTRPGQAREDEASLPVAMSLTNVSVDDEAAVVVRLRSLSDGVIARGSATVNVDLVCNRCLVEWTETLTVPFEQVYGLAPSAEAIESGDELPIEERTWIDLEPVVHDEVSLALPSTPLCRADCRGLCPTCGTDLNTDPCDGHGDVSESPFAALRDLFES